MFFKRSVVVLYVLYFPLFPGRLMVCVCPAVRMLFCGFQTVLTAIRAKHAEAIELLDLPAKDSDRIKAVVDSDLSDIRVLLKAVRVCSAVSLLSAACLVCLTVFLTSCYVSALSLRYCIFFFFFCLFVAIWR